MNYRINQVVAAKKAISDEQARRVMEIEMCVETLSVDMATSRFVLVVFSRRKRKLSPKIIKVSEVSEVLPAKK